MNIEDIKKIAKPYIDNDTKVTIEKTLFDEDNGRAEFNKIIREEVNNNYNYGVYIWHDPFKFGIVYIGMAGKIKQDSNTPNGHTICKRLQASRGKKFKNINFNRDITTNDYVKMIMDDLKIDTIIFQIMYTRKDIPPSFLEALLLFKYYKKTGGHLPRYNKSF